VRDLLFALQAYTAAHLMIRLKMLAR